MPSAAVPGVEQRQRQALANGAAALQRPFEREWRLVSEHKSVRRDP